MRDQGRSGSLWTRQLALFISGGYAILGILYIYFSDQLLLSLLSEPTRLTEVQSAKGYGFVMISGLLLFLVLHLASQAVNRSHRAQLEAVERYQRMIETTNEGVWMLDANARTTFINDTMAEMLGTTRAAVLGQPEAMFLDESWNNVALESLARRRDGSRDMYECQYRCSDGTRLWTIVAASPMLSASGEFIGVLRMVTDITERKKTEQALNESLASQRRLLNELDHRVRNNLTSLISLIDISRGTISNADDFAASIRGRVAAMNHAHSLLSNSGWKSQDVSDLLERLIPAVHRPQVHLDGPTVQCASDISGALAIIFYELITNAIRHGALSRAGGEVFITWSREQPSSDEQPNGRIVLDWTERGGPALNGSIEPGAGLRLVGGLVRSDLRGHASFEFPPSGAHHRLTLNLFRDRT